MVQVNVNGKQHSVDAESDMPLLWVIRELIGLTGTKYGCGIAQCGSCTVLIDGEAVRSCSYPISAVGTRKVTTVEGLASNGKLTKLQAAWVEHQVPQCGYCQSGLLLSLIHI